MSRWIESDNDLVWKYGFGSQDSELAQVPERTGAGVSFYLIDFINTDGERDFTALEKWDTDLLEGLNILEVRQQLDLCPDDLPILRRYIANNPKDDFTDMLTALADYSDGKGEVIFTGEC